MPTHAQAEERRGEGIMMSRFDFLVLQPWSDGASCSGSVLHVTVYMRSVSTCVSIEAHSEEMYTK
jgi:hypothetical protein